ncbi:MAG: HAMP domain-containing histidine kinase [Flavobacteriaceae bacterium]|nr:HAMP domain-containing histidine kinase [Flavobacteriaceae bacterium]
MNNIKYQWILYLIVFVILSTIGIQIYWNYKNYQTNKQQLINDVQVSLDNAVNSYYAKLAERSTLAFAIKGAESGLIDNDHIFLDSIFRRFQLSDHLHDDQDSLQIEIHNGSNVIPGSHKNSVLKTIRRTQLDSGLGPKRMMVKDYNFTSRDSSSLFNFRELTSQVIISMTQDTLNLKQIDSMLQNELSRKNISVVYGLIYECPSLQPQYLNADKTTKPLGEKTDTQKVLTTVSKSSFLPNNSVLQIQFSNETKVILKRIMSGILISTLLVLAVISSLFYLLSIIKRQKQLAEVKNDLIGNITHEFKTPIATIGVALESIKNFEVIEDKDKTRSYLDMSTQQLKKLNTMVEKLLETATLDSEKLAIKKEDIDVIELLSTLVNKHRFSAESKSLTFDPDLDELMIMADPFHFENAINNVLDNAIKYGGEHITVSVKQENNRMVTVEIRDDGQALSSINANKIFEKFYRVPTGNTHDVKGYGIGLFYTKTIVEKHDGQIKLDLENGQTNFKITIPK